jgi:hypothetical protein
MLPDFERAERIGEFWGYPESHNFAELLIDCEEDRTLRAVMVGMLREMERPGRQGIDVRSLPGRRKKPGARQSPRVCSRGRAAPRFWCDKSFAEPASRRNRRQGACG